MCEYSIFSGYISTVNGFITTTLIMFLALFVWLISPVGILFFGAAKILFSPRPSLWKKKIAWILQAVSFLIWFSFMSVLLVIYLDSVWYNIFNLGGNALNLVISSGIGFMFIMFLVVAIEKRIGERRNTERYEINNDENDIYEKNEKQEHNNEERKSPRGKKKNNTIKIAGIEFLGIKEKVRKKIKEDLKEIIDEEIDRRL